MMGFGDLAKFIALSSFVVAFPPVYVTVGKIEGLKLSLAIVLLYLGRALFQLLLEASIRSSPDGTGSNSNSNHRALMALQRTVQFSRVFIFSEIPSVLLAGYLGLRYLPDWVVPIYEKGLLGGGPLMILAEGFATMTIILSSGQLWSDVLSEASLTIKVMVIIGCLGVYGVCSTIIATLYRSGMISSTVGASLVAAFLTIMIILTVATVAVDHGTITDCTLLFLYTTYNLWLIVRSIIVDYKVTGGNSNSTWWQTLKGFPLQLPFTSRLKSLHELFGAALDMFSVEIVAVLAVQMALLIIAMRWYQQHSRGEGMVAEWLLLVVWPLLGRIVLVAVYTYAWLSQTRSEIETSWFLETSTWRWINLFGCLLIYTYHLIYPTHDEGDGKFHVD